MQRTSFLLIIGVLAVLLAAGYSGYNFWQKSVNAQELKKVEKSLEEYQKEALKFENQEVKKAVSAKQKVAEIKSKMVKWSDVIKRIRATVPKREGSPIVNILSYSGSSNTGISMNVKTQPGSEKVYDDAADLIKSFDDSSNFVDSFVPSISSGLDDEGRPVLTFAFSTQYLSDQNIEAALGEILTEALEDDGADADAGAEILR